MSWVVVLVGVELNSSGDPDKDFSCWELVLRKEVRLVVGEVAGPKGVGLTVGGKGCS